jgi:O-antigen biosynthesis protein
MQLSVIIVNYNVKYFVEQCLHSLLAATKNITTEIFVVDNNSKDGSIDYLKPLFNEVIFFDNKKNIGFGKANNLALSQATGDYILFINPDTIVCENTLEYCIHFFEKNKLCGALGVQMLDGSGNFSPESKRAFPSVPAALFKLVGLSKLFPSSATFNKYALGNLAKDEEAEVDVLSGAFFMINHTVAKQTKGFDEDYFMYGEDIDLSYRIQQLGWKNYYLGSQKIIHFKGESTNKGSLNYVKIFYNAMSIFVNKNYKGSKASLYKKIINIGIWTRALITLLQQFIKKNGLVLFDILIVALTLFFVKVWGEKTFANGGAYTSTLAEYFIPLFTSIFIIGSFVSGIYDNLYKPIKVFGASVWAIIIMLAVYSLVPENLRFSRGVILIGGIGSALMITLLRWILHKFGIIKNEEESTTKPLIAIGNINNEKSLLQLLNKTDWQERYLGRITVNEADKTGIGSLDYIYSICNFTQAKEIIFCVDELSYTKTFELMDTLKNLGINFRFYKYGSYSVVGSDNKNENGKTLNNHINFNISNPYQKRMKRIVETAFSILVILIYPFTFYPYNTKKSILRNCLKVVFGKYHWVGYYHQTGDVPTLNPSILSSLGSKKSLVTLNTEVLKRADFLYAKDYKWQNDFIFLIKHYKSLY